VHLPVSACPLRCVRACAMNDEDEWMNAVAALICNDDYRKEGQQWQVIRTYILTNPAANPKPLAAMLRGDTPITREIRDTFAELLDPGEPEYLGCRLVLVETGETEKNILKIDRLGSGNSVSERTVFRHKADWKKVIERLRHTDKKS
jgi:hypothetical protein